MGPLELPHCNNVPLLCGEMQYLYTKTPKSAKPYIVVDSHIGIDAEDGPGIMGSQFADEVYALGNAGKTEAEVLINTPGGKMMEAYSMIGSMDNSPMDFDTLVIGIAGSCGGWLMLKGRRVRMMDYATFMCHDPSGGDGNDSADTAMRMSVATIISEGSGRNGKAKLTTDEALDLMSKSTFLTAYECLDLGLCDEVVKSGDNIYAGMTDKWQAGKTYLNKILKTSKKMDNIKLVTDELELVEEASATAIAKSISNLKNKTVTTEKELATAKETIAKLKNDASEMSDYAEMKNKLDKLSNDFTNLTDKCNSLETENSTLKGKVNEYEDKVKEADKKTEAAKFENSVTDVLKKYANKITKEEMPDLVEFARVTSLEKLENMVKNRPVFGKATDFKTLIKQPEDKTEGSDTERALAKLAAEREAKKAVKK